MCDTSPGFDESYKLHEVSDHSELQSLGENLSDPGVAIRGKLSGEFELLLGFRCQPESTGLRGVPTFVFQDRDSSNDSISFAGPLRDKHRINRDTQPQGPEPLTNEILVVRAASQTTSMLLYVGLIDKVGRHRWFESDVQCFKMSLL